MGKRVNLRRSLGFLFVLSAGVVLATALAGQVKAGPRAAKKPARPASSPENPSPIFPASALGQAGRSIQGGARYESDGETVWVGREHFGPGGAASGVSVPAHLGGGYFFFQSVAHGGSAGTAVYRARDWTGPLTALGVLPFPLLRVEFGFDRAYLFGTGRQVGFDLDQGKVLPLGPLPPLVTLLHIQVAPPKRALIEVPLSGVLLTQDAGATYRRLPEATKVDLSYQGKGLYVRTSSGTAEVLRSGRLRAVSSAAADRSTSDLSDSPARLAAAASWSAAERARDLRTIVERGAVVAGGALGVQGDQALFLSSRQGISIWRMPLSENVGQPCRVVAAAGRGGSKRQGTVAVIAACETPNLGLQVVEVRGKPSRAPGKQLAVRPLVPPAPRTLLAVGEGCLVLSGDCDVARAGSACHVSSKASRSLRFTQVGSGKEALACDDKGVQRIVLESEKEAMLLETWRDGAWSRRRYKFPQDRSGSDLLQAGALLPQASLNELGVAAWAVSGEKFVGLSLGDDPETAFGPIGRPTQRALLQGKHAFVWGAAGFGKQSVDGGLHFEEVDIPHRSGDDAVSEPSHPGANVRMGCSPVGCSLGRFVRLGWGASEALDSSSLERLLVPPPGGGKLHFTCGSPEQSSGPRRPTPQASLPSFWEFPPPQVRAPEQGFSLGFKQDVARLYAVGPSEVDWGRAGYAQLFFTDPFQGIAVYQSARTPRLFERAVSAKQELGLLERYVSNTEIGFDPSGDRGVFLVSTRDHSSLFLFASEQPLARVEVSSNWNLRGLSGVVYSDDWFLGFLLGREFLVARVRAGKFERLAEFSLGDASVRSPRLVRTTSGSLGIFIEGDQGFLIYPLSKEGLLGSPVLERFSSKRPPACPVEARGFIVDREMTLVPYLEQPDGQPLSVSDLSARMLMGHGAACLQSLRGDSRAGLPTRSLRPGPDAVPLYLLDGSETGRRSQLLCN